MEQTRTRLDRAAIAYVIAQGGFFFYKTLTVQLQSPSGNDIFLENLKQGIKPIIGGKDTELYT